jgi:hypothetical protein
MMTDGVRVNVLRDGVPCFVGPNNRTTWLPPGWSQEKIQDFLARQCKLDISKLLVLSSARAVYRKHATSSAAALALAAADTEFSDPSDNEFSDDPHVGFFESPQFKQVLAFFMLLVRAFNVVMASLLVVFVPQRCPGVPGSSDPSMVIPHDCTMHENFNDLTSINTAALWLNFLCLALFLLMFYIEFKREGFMVEFLDLDQFKSLQSLPMELKSHYNIRSILRRFNVGLFTLSVTAIILSAVNLIVSAVVLWRDYYAGTRSITVYVTNLLLLLTVIVSAVNNSWVGLQTEEALSCVDVMPVSYNCVDDDDSATAQKETELEPREYDCLGLAQPLMAKCWPLER